MSQGEVTHAILRRLACTSRETNLVLCGTLRIRVRLLISKTYKKVKDQVCKRGSVFL